MSCPQAAMQGKSDPSEVPDPATMPLNMLQPLLTKPQAREILAASLPVNIEVRDPAHMPLFNPILLTRG